MGITCTRHVASATPLLWLIVVGTLGAPDSLPLVATGIRDRADLEPAIPAATLEKDGAKGNGPSMELGEVLDPLQDFRDRMVFIRGLREIRK